MSKLKELFMIVFVCPIFGHKWIDQDGTNAICINCRIDFNETHDRFLG